SSARSAPCNAAANTQPAINARIVFTPCRLKFDDSLLNSETTREAWSCPPSLNARLAACSSPVGAHYRLPIVACIVQLATKLPQPTGLPGPTECPVRRSLPALPRTRH